LGDYRFWNGLDYLEMERNDESWLVEPLLSPGALANIYGATKTGKSRLALQLAIAMSTDEAKWLDRFRIHTHGPVLWLECDNSPAEWVQVLRDVRAEGYDLSNIHFTDRDWAPYPMDLLDEEADHAGILEDMIERFVRNWGVAPIMVVIDTIREVHSGDEDKSTIMRNVITKLQKVTYPAALLLISHSRKGAGFPQTRDEGVEGVENSGSTADEQRGSNYLVGKMQTVIRVTRGKHNSWFTAIGRSIGTERFKMKQVPPSYLWYPDTDATQAVVKELAKKNPTWSDRRVAREVAQLLKIDGEKARNIVRKKDAGG
jgi:hypothetical protein